MNLLSRWFTFVKERFEPVSHTVMIFAFASANAAMAYAVSPFAIKERAAYLFGGFMLVWLVFFHMRLFDDIKDYETDSLVNKERPLPRGVLTINEFGAGILICVIAEIALSSALGFKIFSTYALVLAFTLIMRQEFFIGEWMRPKMELYAATHTFSASMLGLLIYSVLNNAFITEIPAAYLYAAFGNWFVFNVFEFGRKTFSIKEERDGVDSYSLRLSPFGAFALLSVNIFFAFLMLYLCADKINQAAPGGRLINFMPMLASAALISFTVICAGMVYSRKPSDFNAKFYRGAVSFYLVAYHFAIAICGFIYLN
jgi:4-hydroxybenzoate polyprenyltransferase